MFNVAENRHALYEEVEELRLKSLKHFDELSKVENEKRIVESKLDDTLRAIEKDQENIKVEQVQWVKAKLDLIMDKDWAVIAKVNVEAKMVKAEQDLATITFKLKTAEAKAVLAKEKATWS